MKRRRGSFRRSTVALVAVCALGVWQLLLALDDDRVAAVAAGLMVAACLCAGARLGWSALSPPMLYLWVFALFHLGLAVPWALDLYQERLPPWLVSNRLTPALALVALAAGAYLAGLLWAGPARRERGPTPVITNRFLFWAGAGIYLAGCGMFLLGIQSLGGWRFFDVGYAETYQLAAKFDPRLFGTSFTVAPVGLYLAAAAFPRRWLWAVVAGSAIWVAGIFFLGFRGFALIPGLVVLGVIERRGYRLPGWMAAALVAGMLVGIPMTRQMREEGVRQRSLALAWDRAHWLDGIVEMGGSLRPLVHTLVYVESESWRWGTTYWQSLGTIWPNLSRRWEGGRWIPLEELPPNHWLTAQAEPGMYRQYGGLGFSAVAEPYMNFGVAGVAGYFLALGALLARTAELAPARPVALALAAVVLGPLLWTVRNSSEIFFRPAVWGAAIVLAAWLASPLARAAGGWRSPPRRARAAPPGADGGRRAVSAVSAGDEETVADWSGAHARAGGH